MATKTTNSAIAKLDQARQLLAECHSIGDAKLIRDQAEAMRTYAKQQSAGLDAQNYAAEIKLRAERKCGELLAAMDLKERRQSNLKQSPKSHDVTSVELSDLGISKSQSHRWQMEALVPDEEFHEFVRSTHESAQELTSSRLYKIGKKLAAAEVGGPADIISLNQPTESRVVSSLDELAGEKFGTIYADPPWKYGNQATRAATSDHYSTLTVDELCDWQVADLAADDSHLHLWTTNAFLFDAKRVMDAWGFEYRSVFVWVKPQMGIGNYWRVSHEFLLLGIRGNAKRFNNRSLMSWGQFSRGKHSSKPDEIRDFIQSASPGPYLEMFGRKTAEGWTVMGNQVERRLIPA